MSEPMPHGKNETTLYPALAMLLFAVGALLSLEAKHFGWSAPVSSMLTIMWALLFAAGALQLSVTALLLLPVSAVVFGAAAVDEARSVLCAGEPLQMLYGGIPLLLLVPLFFLLFCRGMTQGSVLRRQLLDSRVMDRRELLFSFAIMFGPAVLYLLYRSIIDRY